MTPEQVLQAIENGAEVDVEMWDSVRLPWQILPAEYLDFAKHDIVTRDRRGTVNALSNAKRALECQFDSLIHGLDILPQGAKRLNVPQKVELLRECNIIAPRVLERLNKHRNQLEHEYICPELGIVEDFIDVVSLFLEATKQCIDDRPCEWTVTVDPHQQNQRFVRVKRAPNCLFYTTREPQVRVTLPAGTPAHANLLKALVRRSL